MTVTIDAKAPSRAPATAGRDRQSPSAGAADRRLGGSPRHLVGADALRALAALAVIVVHTSAWPPQSRGADAAAWYSTTLIGRFSVPAFVLLTGLVLAYRYGEQRLGREFLLKRARRSVVPWLVWAPLFCLFGVFLSGDIDPTWSGVRDWWSSGGGHLYFLVLVPQFYVLMLLWPSHRRATVALAAAALAVMVGLDTFRLYTPIAAGTAMHQVVLDHGFLEFPFWIGYFAIGVAAGRMLRARDARGWPAWPFAVAVPLTAGAMLSLDTAGMASPDYADGTGAFLRPLLVPFTLAVCAAVVFGAPALLRRMPRLARATAVLSRHSLGVYIVHPLLLAAFGPRIVQASGAHLPWSVPLFLALTVVTAVAALLLVMMLVRTPLAVTIGEQRAGRGRPGGGGDEGQRELVGRRAGTSAPAPARGR